MKRQRSGFAKTRDALHEILRRLENHRPDKPHYLDAGGDIELEVAGIDFKTFLGIRKALADLERIKSVDGDFTKGTGLYRIKAQFRPRRWPSS